MKNENNRDNVTEESTEIIVHVTKKNTIPIKKEIVSTYKGQENGDLFRLIRFQKDGKDYSGIEIKKSEQKTGWSMVTKAERPLEPAMWESYWRHKALSGDISIQESVMRTAAYVIDIFGSLEDILVNNENPEIANALQSVLTAQNNKSLRL